MRRTMMESLVEWKSKPDRMPLILLGARQVGKTWLLEDFGKRYFEDIFYVNFEVDAALSQDFEGSLEPERLVNLLEAYFGRRIVPGTTLIVFDEVQACGRALTSLKYFRERAPQYNIIAAGSTPGVSVKSKPLSFLVGNVELLTLHPLDFEEFLEALGENLLAASIRESFGKNIALPDSLHSKAMDAYRSYLVVGGMPGAINAYLRERRVMAAAQVQRDILSAYIADMTKYASPAETAKSGIPAHVLLSEHAGVTFSGAVAENYVAQSLQSKGYPLFYWESEGKAEIDFIVPQGEALVPIEVKSGDHSRSRSLSVYGERFKPELSIRLSAKRFGFEGGVKSVPLYAAFCV